MRTSAQFLRPASSVPQADRGFTLLEVLVVLLIVGLLVSLVAPGAVNLVGAATRESQRREIASAIERLPVEARLTGRLLVLDGTTPVPGLNAAWRVTLARPLRVQPSGVCSESDARVDIDGQTVVVHIAAPFCRVRFD
jgi:prepilin-type N-terminal cleavage/methylation domain-containing protein